VTCTAAGSNGLLRAARRGEQAPGIAQDVAGERDDGAALAYPPPSPRPAHQQQRKTRRRAGRARARQRMDSCSTLQAGSNGLLRARVAEGGQRRARAAGEGVARERSRSTFEVLKSTGCPKTVHDPAFRARCACPPPRGGRPGPEEGLLPAVIRREKAAIRRRPSRRIYRKLQFVMNTR
jgi:hypothetical protein